MRKFLFPIRLCVLLWAGFLASCATQNRPTAPTSADGMKGNPHPPGSYAHFIAEPGYPKTYSYWKDDELLSRTNPENSRIVIDVKTQRAKLMNGDEIAMDYPICSGRPSHPTPPGEYEILERVVDKRSNKYGRIYDAEGKVVNSDADVTRDPIPEGGRFQGASMRYWMRMTWTGIGMHVGPVKRVPVSHACVRGPASIMPIVYAKSKLGTRVTVQ
jgi:hypothetical protein